MGINSVYFQKTLGVINPVSIEFSQGVRFDQQNLSCTMKGFNETPQLSLVASLNIYYDKLMLKLKQVLVIGFSCNGYIVSYRQYF